MRASVGACAKATGVSVSEEKQLNGKRTGGTRLVEGGGVQSGGGEGKIRTNNVVVSFAP